jgi:hypothetical protein
MKKWQQWVVTIAAIVTCLSAIGSFANSAKTEDKTNTETGTETACVQVVEG